MSLVLDTVVPHSTRAALCMCDNAEVLGNLKRLGLDFFFSLFFLDKAIEITQAALKMNTAAAVTVLYSMHIVVQYRQYLHAPRRASFKSGVEFRSACCAREFLLRQDRLRGDLASFIRCCCCFMRTVLSSDYVSRCAKKAPPRVHELGRRARIVDECSLRSFLLHPRTARHLHRLLHLTRVVRRLTVAGLFCHPARARSNLYDLLGMSAQLVLDKIRALFPPGSPAS